MYLTRLAADEAEANEEYSNHLAKISSSEDLMDVIKALKCKLVTDDYEAYFEPLREYVKKFGVKYSNVLKSSHVFCDSCDLYVPSFLCVWERNNRELFDTEVYFFHRFFTYFKDLIKPDVNTYPESELYNGDDEPLSGQTKHEKLKLLASVIKYYDRISS